MTKTFERTAASKEAHNPSGPVESELVRVEGRQRRNQVN